MLSEPMLTVTPPSLLRFMKADDLSRSIMALDVEARTVSDACLRMELNIVIQPVAVRRGFVTRCDYYVGTTGARVTVTATGGQVVEHSGPSSLQVQHELNRGSEKADATKLTPEFKAKIGHTEIETAPGVIETSSKNSTSTGIKFATEEMLLAPINLSNAVIWHIDSHRGDKAVRDFLVGNIHLQATFTWNSLERKGTIQARPSDVRFFDSERRPLSGRASILMRFRLWRRGVKLLNCDGIEVAFKECGNERILSS